MIADAVELAETFFERLVGLLGRRTFRPGEALVIRPCNNVHCFFMRFPIDVVFCDRDGRILRIVAELKPWRISPFVRRSSFVVELPPGQAAALQLRPGDLLLVEGSA